MSFVFKPARDRVIVLGPLPAFAILSRIIAAVFGGYAFAAVATVFLSFILPLPRGEAVMTATLLSFAIYVAAVVWVFAARTALRAWLGLAIPAAIMAAGSYAFTLGTSA